MVGDWYNYTSAAGVLPQMGTAVSRFGAAIQASFTAATSASSDAAQNQRNLLAIVPNANDSESTDTSSRVDEVLAADHDHDHEYMVLDMVPAQPTGTRGN